MGTSSKALFRKLDRLARRQHGCFTAAQAIAIGYADSVHLYHVKTGSWVRLSRGVYRLSTLPETPESICMAALLWTRNKNGKIEGILAPPTSTNLVAGSLDPSLPIHIAVKKQFRRSSSVPDGIVLSSAGSHSHKTSKYGGFPVLLPTPVAHPGPQSVSIHPGLPQPAPSQDIPDYYDWLDYQAVLCDRPS